MKKEIADRWIEALESGEYKQTTGALRNSKGFCCLGVLCDLAHKEGLIGVRTYSSDVFQYDDSCSILPKSVRIWAGMADANGQLLNGTYLTQLNDERGYSFKDIANKIREEWETL